MAALQERLPASFRGISYLSLKGHTESGRHEVLHEYPDASHRYAEDNGLRVPDFHETALIHGADAIARMRRFEAALRTPGPGTLIHPDHGRQWVQVGKYSLKHDQGDIGVYTFEIAFHVTGPPIFPGILSGIAAAITGLSASALTAMFNEFKSALVSPVSYLSQQVLGGAASAIIGTVAAEFGNVATVALMARQVARSPEYIVADAQRFGDTLFATMRAPFDDLTVPQSRLWSGMADVADAATAVLADAAAITPNTPDLASRQTALVLLGATMMQAAFVSLCEAAAGKTYATVAEVSADIATLSDMRRSLAGIMTSPAVKAAVDHIYAETMQVLQKEQVTLPDVMKIRVNELPASEIAYQLYDGIGDLTTLVGLNAGQSPALYDEQVSVLRRY